MDLRMAVIRIDMKQSKMADIYQEMIERNETMIFSLKDPE